MIMVNFDFLSNPINLEEGSVQTLCLENPKLFRSVFNALLLGETEENKIVFSEKFIPFKFKGNICVIDDYFRLSYSNAVMKKLYEQMERQCNNERSEDTVNLKSHIINYMAALVKDFDYDFDFNYDITLTEIFKAISLKPVTEYSNNIDIVLDYILIINRYVPQKCFVLFNLHLYFTEEEIEAFYTDILNNHIRLLVIENKKFFKKSRFENIIVYDNDFCEIIDNSQKLL